MRLRSDRSDASRFFGTILRAAKSCALSIGAIPATLRTHSQLIVGTSSRICVKSQAASAAQVGKGTKRIRFPVCARRRRRNEIALKPDHGQDGVSRTSFDSRPYWLASGLHGWNYCLLPIINLKHGVTSI